MLAAGFVYSAFGTAREYRRIASQPAVSGSDATIDEVLAPLKVRAHELRQALADVDGSPGPIAFIAPSSLPDRDVQQAFFAISYLLAPQPLPLVRWCDEEQTACTRKSIDDGEVDARRRGLKRAVVFGDRNPFPARASRRIAERVWLVQW
jgi:hypothetical protein